MIVAVDQLLWRPLVVWSQKFRVEETGSEEAAGVVGRLAREALAPPPEAPPVDPPPARGGAGAGGGREAPSGFERQARGSGRRSRPPLVGRGLLAAAVALWGAARLGVLLVRVPAREWGVLALSLGATALRTPRAPSSLSVLWTVPVGILLGRSPHLVAEAPARHPDRRVVPGADALPARHGGAPRRRRPVRRASRPS